MAQLLSHAEYYVLRRNIRPDVVELPEERNRQWAGACPGGAACGDECVMPHKGIRGGLLRMFIARKPHSTGIKLYCLADATSGYVVDMCLYMNKHAFWIMTKGQTASCTHRLIDVGILCLGRVHPIPRPPSNLEPVCSGMDLRGVEEKTWRRLHV